MVTDRQRNLFGRMSMRVRLLVSFGPMLMLAGCPSGAGVDPDSIGPFPPKAPNQRMFICDRTIGWELPREREGGDFLAQAEIKTVTIYAARTPMAPDNELAFIMDVDPYLLQWQFQVLDPGVWYFRLTATDNKGLESKQSNERSNEECV